MSHTVLYFGVYERPGHFLWRPGMLPAPIDRQPWGWSVDASLCPGVVIKNGVVCITGEQPEGLGLIHHKDDWTAWAFWDRSGDERNNSNSVFLAQGYHGFETMKRLAEEYFPEIWKRLTFEFTLEGNR